MSKKSKMAAILLNVPIAMSGQARLIISKAGGKKPPKSTGLTKYQINGVTISDIDFEQINGNWNMLECDIIIIPKTLHKKFTMDDSRTIGAMLTSGYENPKYWREHEKLELK